MNLVKDELFHLLNRFLRDKIKAQTFFSKFDRHFEAATMLLHNLTTDH